MLIDGVEENPRMYPNLRASLPRSSTAEWTVNVLPGLPILAGQRFATDWARMPKEE